MTSKNSAFIDRSILRPYLNHYFLFLFKLVPRRLPANFITLITWGFMWIMLFFSSHADAYPVEVLVLISLVCIHFYTVGDHLDGMQAIATRTTSPLGGFFDHYCDVYSGAIMVITFFQLMGSVSAPVLYGVLWLYLMAFNTTYVEELEKKELHFGSVGSLEGIVILFLFFASLLFSPIRNFWMAEIIEGYPNYWVIILLGIFGFSGTTLSIIKRMGSVPRQLTVFLICSFSLTIFLSTQNIITEVQGWLILTLYGTGYLGSVMRSQMLSEKHHYPDLMASVAIFIIWPVVYIKVFPEQILKGLTDLFLIYLIIYVLLILLRILSQFRDHWLWINPR